MNPFPHLNFPFVMTFTWKHATLFKTWSLGKRRWSKWKRLGNSWDSKGKMNQRNSSCFSASTFRNIGIWRESVFLVGGSFESLTMNWVFFFFNLLKLRKKWILLSCHSVGRFWWLIMSSCQAVLYPNLYGGMKIPCLPFSWVGVHDMYILYIIHEYV